MLRLAIERFRNGSRLVVIVRFCFCFDIRRLIIWLTACFLCLISQELSFSVIISSFIFLFSSLSFSIPNQMLSPELYAPFSSLSLSSFPHFSIFLYSDPCSPFQASMTFSIVPIQRERMTEICPTPSVVEITQKYKTILFQIHRVILRKCFRKVLCKCFRKNSIFMSLVDRDNIPSTLHRHTLRSLSNAPLDCLSERELLKI